MAEDKRLTSMSTYVFWYTQKLGGKPSCGSGQADSGCRVYGLQRKHKIVVSVDWG
jgi:hypothetical protein